MTRILRLAAVLAAWMTLVATPAIAFAAEEGDKAHDKASVVPTPAQAWAPLVATILVFGIVIIFLHQMVWPKILKGLDERSAKIREEIESAEAARQQAKDALEMYEQNLAEAQAEAKKMLEATKAQQTQLAAELTAKAERDVYKRQALGTPQRERSEAMTTIEAPNPSLTTATSPSGATLRAPLGRLASLALGACLAGALLPAIAHVVTGATLPEAMSISGMGVGIVAGGALLGLLTFAMLGSKTIFNWSVIVIGESAIRLALTLGVAALIAFELTPAKLPFWGGYLLASLGVLVAWTLTFRQRLLAAQLQDQGSAQADSESA